MNQLLAVILVAFLVGTPAAFALIILFTAIHYT